MNKKSEALNSNNVKSMWKSPLWYLIPLALMKPGGGQATVSVMPITAFKGKIVYPTSSTYDQDRMVFNKNIDAKPAVIFFCNDAEDIKVALNYAKSVKRPVRIRSNRHSYEAFSTGNDVIVIDTSDLTTFQLSPDKATVKVGSGNDLYTIYQKLWEHKLTIPGGSCPTVGIAGLTLGGGIGFCSRFMGMAVDNLIELELVSSDGKFLIVNKESNPDLFWACCGAGAGNFGVITSLTFKTYPVNNVAIYRIEWDWEHLQDVTHNWFKMLETAPNELMLFMRFYKQGSTKSILSFGQYFGSLVKLKEMLSDLLQIPYRDNILLKEVSYMEAINEWGKVTDPDHYREKIYAQRKSFKAASFYLTQPLSKQALDMMDKYYSDPNIPYNDAINATIIDSYGGKINMLSSDHNAFPHRNTLGSIQLLVYWDNDITKTKQLQWLKDYYTELSAFGEGAYSNYPDLTLTDWATRYYGNNLKRLQQIKQKYDPHNVFHYEQSIPLPKAINKDKKDTSEKRLVSP